MEIQVLGEMETKGNLFVTQDKALEILSQAGWVFRRERVCDALLGAILPTSTRDLVADTDVWYWCAHPWSDEGVPLNGTHRHKGEALRDALESYFGGSYREVRVL